MKSTFPKIVRNRYWDPLLALSLFLMFFIAATRLMATKWTDHLSIVQTIFFLGLISGIALGQSIFSPPLVRFFAFAYGLFVVPWQLGLTLGEDIQWSERLISIANRLLITIDQLVQQKPVTDNLFFLTLMSILFWVLSTDSAYHLIRYGNAWRAILPIGLTIFIIQAYDPYIQTRGWFIAFFLFFSLLLLARLYYLRQQRKWKQRNSYLPPYLGLDHIRVVILTSLILMILAWTVPALASSVPSVDEAWRKISAPWIIIRGKISHAFANLRSSVGFVTDFYGDTLPLGRGTPLSDTVILTIQSSTRTIAGVRYYWRARVYDQYYDGQWTNTFTTIRSLSPEEFPLPQSDYEGRIRSRFTIKTHQPIQNLYTPAEPLWISRPVQAHLKVNEDNTTDLGFLLATPYLHNGEVYQVESSLSAATITQLRSAGTDYPQWVTSRYLQLPENITLRTRQLAEQIAFGLDNPYDIAEAITNYLRENLTYAETIPAPPANREPLDWVLFEHKQAFCNYYASIEVVMLRSLGIPARLAVGYAEGQRTFVGGPERIIPQQAEESIPQEMGREQEVYTVRHRDAHAWPEVYFPGIGWVEFEPTTSQAPLLRPVGALSDEESTNATQREEFLRRMLNQRNQALEESQLSIGPFTSSSEPMAPMYWIIILGVLLTCSSWFIYRWRQKRGSKPLPVQIENGLRSLGIHPPRFLHRWAQYAMLPQIARAYFEINRALVRLHVPPRKADTPLERASRLRQLLPHTEDSISRLVNQYQSCIYGHNQMIVNENAVRDARIIRWQSILTSFMQRFARFQEPKPMRKGIDRT